jgi:hypothetical protein
MPKKMGYGKDYKKSMTKKSGKSKKKMSYPKGKKKK